MSHSFVQVITRGKGTPGDGTWDVGNVLRVFRLEDDPAGGYFIHIHRDYGHWTQRNWQGRWIPGPSPIDRSTSAGWVKVMGKDERNEFAFYVIRGTHPDDLVHLEGPGNIQLNLNVLHVADRARLDHIFDRTRESPVVENLLTRAKLLAAAHGPNYGLTQDQIVAKMRLLIDG